MSLDIVFNNIQSFAALITAITIIGTAFIWVYQKTIGKAKERKEEERAKLLREKIAASNQPLIETLNNMNEEMAERKRHDDKLDRIAEQTEEILNKHENRLDGHDEDLEKHNVRLVTLEIKGGIRKLGYAEREGEENGNSTK